MDVTILLTIIAAFVLSVVATNNTCYNPAIDFHKLMGTKTAYQLVRGMDDLRPLRNEICQPLQIWVLVRHGTRYPENSIVQNMLNFTDFRNQILKNHKMGNGELCNADLQKLRDWKLDPKINNQTHRELVPQGEKDLEELAIRLKAAYPELLQFSSTTFEPTDFKFKSTNTQRTLNSMMAFKKGIFGRSNITVPTTIAHDNDTVLLPHKNCKAWNYESDKIYAANEEINKGPEVTGLLMRLSKKLGFNKTLDYDTMKIAYDICRYEVSWHPDEGSIWCLIFKKEDLEILEHVDDFNYYYFCGPGRKMSGKLGCKTLVDLFEHFKKIEDSNGKNQPKGIFYFGHTLTLQPLLTAMKIGKEDTPFTSKTFALNTQRKYHISRLGPFASNLVAVMYRCSSRIAPVYKVSLHVAENPAPISVCNNGLCDWEDLKKEYESVIDNCSFDFCNNAGAMHLSFKKIVFFSFIISTINLLFL